jgi:hypothetical protein
MAMTYLFFYFSDEIISFSKRNKLTCKIRKRNPVRKKITGFQVHIPNKFAYTSQVVYTLFF